MSETPAPVKEFEFFHPDNVDVSFDSILGLEKEKRKIINLLTGYKEFPEISRPSIILLFGYPGMGCFQRKTNHLREQRIKPCNRRCMHSKTFEGPKH